MFASIVGSEDDEISFTVRPRHRGILIHDVSVDSLPRWGRVIKYSPNPYVVIQFSQDVPVTIGRSRPRYGQVEVAFSETFYYAVRSTTNSVLIVSIYHKSILRRTDTFLGSYTVRLDSSPGSTSTPSESLVVTNQFLEGAGRGNQGGRISFTLDYRNFRHVSTPSTTTPTTTGTGTAGSGSSTATTRIPRNPMTRFLTPMVAVDGDDPPHSDESDVSAVGSVSVSSVSTSTTSTNPSSSSGERNQTEGGGEGEGEDEGEFLTVEAPTSPTSPAQSPTTPLIEASIEESRILAEARFEEELRRREEELQAKSAQREEELQRRASQLQALSAEKEHELQRRSAKFQALSAEKEEELHRREEELQNRLKDLDKKYESFREARECCVCLDREKTIAFMPCGHVCVCQTCQSIVDECPLCRVRIRSRLKVYL